MRTFLAASIAALAMMGSVAWGNCSFTSGPAYEAMVRECGGDRYVGTCDGQAGPICAAAWARRCQLQSGESSLPDSQIREALRQTCANYNAMAGGTPCRYCQQLN